MTLHVCEFGECGVVPKCQDQVDMKPEELLCPWIQCLTPLRQPSKFLVKWNEVRVKVLDHCWRRNDGITQEPSKAGVNFRWKVEVDQDHWPSRHWGQRVMY